MFTRILFLTVVLMQLSGCIATPRIFSNIHEDYEPPEEEPPQEQNKHQPNEEQKYEIRHYIVPLPK